jgi:S-phase kinase-associated protein 1
MSAKQLLLICSTGESLPISEDAAKVSGLLSDAWNDGNDTVPFTEISAAVLQQVIEYCEHHARQPCINMREVLIQDSFADCVSAWDVAFMDKPMPELLAIVKAANFMDIRSLVLLFCAKYAYTLRGLTPAQINDKYKVPQERRGYKFTKEERDAIMKYNDWRDYENL